MILSNINGVNEITTDLIENRENRQIYHQNEENHQKSERNWQEFPKFLIFINTQNNYENTQNIADFNCLNTNKMIYPLPYQNYTFYNPNNTYLQPINKNQENDINSANYQYFQRNTLNLNNYYDNSEGSWGSQIEDPIDKYFAF